jgi:hypothetical protein
MAISSDKFARNKAATTQPVSHLSSLVFSLGRNDLCPSVKKYSLAQSLLIITIRSRWLPFVDLFMRFSRCTAGLHDLGQIALNVILYKFLAQGCWKVVLRVSVIDSFVMCSICTA